MHLFFLHRTLMETSTELEFAPHFDKASILTIKLSTADVETVYEIPAYYLWGFVGNVAGNLGMIFGTSLYSIGFSAITSYDR